MKKRLLTGFIVVAVLVLSLTTFGCSAYSSHYKAVAFVHTNTAKNASMKFSSFEGTMVFKLKCENNDEKINFSAQLDNGSAKVFYDCNGTKTELISVNSGNDINDIGGELQKGTVYIIVETDETCKGGQFNFEIK